MIAQRGAGAKPAPRCLVSVAQQRKRPRGDLQEGTRRQPVAAVTGQTDEGCAFAFAVGVSGNAATLGTLDQPRTILDGNGDLMLTGVAGDAGDSDLMGVG